MRISLETNCPDNSVSFVVIKSNRSGYFTLWLDDESSGTHLRLTDCLTTIEELEDAIDKARDNLADLLLAV